MQMTCTAGCGWTGNRTEAKLVEPNKETGEYPENPYLCGNCGKPAEPARITAEGIAAINAATAAEVITAADVAVVTAETLLGKK